MNRRIYVLRDQVSGQYGGVFDFATDAECIRHFKALYESGQFPDYVFRDSVILQLADVDFSNAAPVVSPLMPVIIFYGSEVLSYET